MFPPLKRRAPNELSPVPLIVIASAIVRPPLIFNLAPSATVVAPSVAPKPFACVICNKPALTVTAPV